MPDTTLNLMNVHMSPDVLREADAYIKEQIERRVEQVRPLVKKMLLERMREVSNRGQECLT